MHYINQPYDHQPYLPVWHHVAHVLHHREVSNPHEDVERPQQGRRDGRIPRWKRGELRLQDFDPALDSGDDNQGDCCD